MGGMGGMPGMGGGGVRLELFELPQAPHPPNQQSVESSAALQTPSRKDERRQSILSTLFIMCIPVAAVSLPCGSCATLWRKPLLPMDPVHPSDVRRYAGWH